VRLGATQAVLCSSHIYVCCCVRVCLFALRFFDKYKIDAFLGLKLCDAVTTIMFSLIQVLFSTTTKSLGLFDSRKA
jgi:hypothetical protein